MLLPAHVLKGFGTPFTIKCLMHRNHLRGIFEIQKDTKISCKIRPYTLRSNFSFARKSPSLLGAGALAAHRRDRLMLLGSPPDMVHGCRLRKTHSSSQQRALRTASLRSSRRGSTPAIADFRCRAPLLPRLVWPYFTAYLIYYNRFACNLQGCARIFRKRNTKQNRPLLGRFCFDQ